MKQAKISPWRFDHARNASLEMVPEDGDICVCTDLDEVFRPGWRDVLEENWKPETTQARYEYVWSFDAKGKEDVVFFGEKIHARHGYEWHGAVHEVLKKQAGVPCFVTIPQLRLEHYPDSSKSRGQYLPLLELAVSEEPENDRNMHYLGREYYFNGRYRESMDVLQRHLSLKSARWPAERAASMRYIAGCCQKLGRQDEAERWLLFACAEEPSVREGWTELSAHYLARGNYSGAYFAAQRALSIEHREKSYITDGRCWGSLPYDLSAVSAWHLGLFDKAAELGERALEYAPEDERLRANMVFYRQSLGKR